ncbi:MAG: type II secretion system F family protein [Phycisphaerales bacterium]|nr:MAG: type II secretion system F family protein [Phycisphaerales bacterium]
MPSFRYQSMTTAGESRSGTISAADRADAVKALLGRGETALTIDPVDTREAKRNGKAAGARSASKSRPKSATTQDSVSKFDIDSLVSRFSASMLRSRRHRSLSLSEMSNFIRELATAIEAGLPLMQSLRTVRKQAHGKAMPQILDHLIARVEAGDPLHKAAKSYGPPFDDMVLGMLRAADASGEMSTVLHQLADLLERSVELRREVMGATLYPMIVAGFIAASAVVLVTVLVPNLIGPLTEGTGAITLPWPTEVVLWTSEMIAAYWLYGLIGIVVGFIGWRAWVNVPANRYRVDLLKLRIPVAGRLLRDVAVARFTRTLGTLTSAGLPILESLRITQNVLVNRALVEALDDVQDKVTSGKSLAEPLERSGLFPPLLVQVVSLGERSGRLESMLMHAATAFDRQVNASLKLFSRVLPPFLLIVMAGLGAFILAAILLPLLELQGMVG